MRTSKKLILTAACIGTLGFAGLSRVVFAKQPQSFVAITRQYHNGIQVAEASDGDGEKNDDAEEQQEAAKLQLMELV
ncbi:hypothetical protein [Nostoc sp.]|uniref:hypothetical protein n=1 Tax=Nostoc sp. TaxID=1180 RepID=UPI002FF48826